LRQKIKITENPELCKNCGKHKGEVKTRWCETCLAKEREKKKRKQDRASRIAAVNASR
jgi:hypothetical protein